MPMFLLTLFDLHTYCAPSIHIRLNEVRLQLFTGVMAFIAWWYGTTWMPLSAIATRPTDVESSTSNAEFRLALYPYRYNPLCLWVLVMAKSTRSLSLSIVVFPCVWSHFTCERYSHPLGLSYPMVPVIAWWCDSIRTCKNGLLGRISALRSAYWQILLFYFLRPYHFIKLPFSFRSPP